MAAIVGFVCDVCGREIRSKHMPCLSQNNVRYSTEGALTLSDVRIMRTEYNEVCLDCKDAIRVCLKTLRKTAAEPEREEE